MVLTLDLFDSGYQNGEELSKEIIENKMHQLRRIDSYIDWETSFCEKSTNSSTKVNYPPPMPLQPPLGGFRLVVAFRDKEVVGVTSLCTELHVHLSNLL
jgi:hypothetical protein